MVRKDGAQEELAHSYTQLSPELQHPDTALQELQKTGLLGPEKL